MGKNKKPLGLEGAAKAMKKIIAEQPPTKVKGKQKTKQPQKKKKAATTSSTALGVKFPCKGVVTGEKLRGEKKTPAWVIVTESKKLVLDKGSELTGVTVNVNDVVDMNIVAGRTIVITDAKPSILSRVYNDLHESTVMSINMIRKENLAMHLFNNRVKPEALLSKQLTTDELIDVLPGEFIAEYSYKDRDGRLHERLIFATVTTDTDSSNSTDADSTDVTDTVAADSTDVAENVAA